MLELIQQLQNGDPRKGLYLCDDFVSEPVFQAYVDFPARVQVAAQHFRALGVQAGEPVIFPFETSAEVIFAFLGMMELGALPLSVKPHMLGTPKAAYLDFIARIASGYGAHKVLDVPSVRGLDLSLQRVALPPSSIGIAQSDTQLREPPADELAFVQFSSGSTSFPKGVPITHANLRLNLQLIAQTDGRSTEDRVTSWLPLYHDMGLIGGLLTCLVIGHDLYLSQPAAFLMDPIGWLEQMSELRQTGSVIPNFAIDYALKMLKTMDAEDLAQLDLSSVRTIYLGSEPINIPNLQLFLELLAPCGLPGDVFLACYGMAEAVLMVSCQTPGTRVKVVTAPNGQPAVSVGRMLPGFELRLRDEEGQLCGEHRLGEIELNGGSLADSYYLNDKPLRGEDGFYSSGDLGFVLDGELYITGRVNDRIKLNGQSFFSGDFEQAVERVPFIRPGRSAVIQTQGRVVVLAEVRHPSALARETESRQRVSATVLEHVGVKIAPEDVLFIRYGQLLKTSSGKLQRRAISEAYEAGNIRLVTPMQLRRDLVQMRAQRVVYVTVHTVRKRGSRLVSSGRSVLKAGLKRLRKLEGAGV